VRNYLIIKYFNDPNDVFSRSENLVYISTKNQKKSWHEIFLFDNCRIKKSQDAQSFYGFAIILFLAYFIAHIPLSLFHLFTD